MNRMIAIILCAWLLVSVAAVFSEKPAATTAAPAQVTQQDTASPQTPNTPSASIWGTVRDASGKPVEGAVVSVRAGDQLFTTSVYTDDNGEYVTPPLSARRYRMWAQAVGFATARAEVALDRPASQLFTLEALEDFGPQLTGTEWFDSLRDTTREDRRSKQILRVLCSDCHTLAVVLQNRFDEAGWRTLIQAMSESSHTGWRPSGARSSVAFLSQLIRYHRDDLAAYLARVRGPSSPPLKYAVKPRPRGVAAQAVATQYDVPMGERLNEMPWFTGAEWSEGPAVGTHGIVGPHDVTADKNGIVWVHEGRRSFETNRGMTKIDLQTGRMWAMGYMRNGRVAGGEQVIFDEATNMIWGATTRWDPVTETATEFPTPPAFLNFVNSHDVDSKGGIWSNVFYGSARLAPATKQWKVFMSSPPYDGFSYGMAADANDNAWWSAWNGDAIYKGDIETDKVVEIPMRDPEYAERKALATKADLEFYESVGSLHWGGLGANPVPYANAPRRMSADKRGNKVWVPNWAGMNLAEVDIHSLQVTYHQLPLNGMAYRVVVDAQRNVWAIVPMGDMLVKYDIKTKTWTQYPLPLHGCGSRHLAVDNVRGEMWVPCDQASSVVRFQFRTADQIRAQKVAAQGK